MSLLTEGALRLQLKNQDLGTLEQYCVPAGTIVTPAAQSFLSDHKIQLRFEPEQPSPPLSSKTRQSPAQQDTDTGNLPPFEPPRRYQTMWGAYYDHKPEHMTALRGPNLVHKNHPIIRWRGQIDSLEASILQVSLRMQQLGNPQLTQDLGQVLEYVREILRCEVLDQPLSDPQLLGLNTDQLRAHSHSPKKYYGVNHFAPALEHGEAVILLNSLRTQSRQVELCAYDAFADSYGTPTRMDIIQGLNRLSSVFYVMMVRVRAQEHAL